MVIVPMACFCHSIRQANLTKDRNQKSTRTGKSIRCNICSGGILLIPSLNLPSSPDMVTTWHILHPHSRTYVITEEKCIHLFTCGFIPLKKNL